MQWNDDDGDHDHHEDYIGKAKNIIFIGKCEKKGVQEKNSRCIHCIRSHHTLYYQSIFFFLFSIVAMNPSVSFISWISLSRPGYIPKARPGHATNPKKLRNPYSKASKKTSVNAKYLISNSGKGAQAKNCVEYALS